MTLGLYAEVIKRYDKENVKGRKYKNFAILGEILS